jgi:hypothetical protein
MWGLSKGIAMTSLQRWGMGVGIGLLAILVLGSVALGLLTYPRPSGASPATLDAQRQAVLEVAKRELPVWLKKIPPSDLARYRLEGVDLASIEALTPIPRIFAAVDETHMNRHAIEHLLSRPSRDWLVPLASGGQPLLVLLVDSGLSSGSPDVYGIGFSRIAERLQQGLNVLGSPDPQQWGSLAYLYFETPTVDVLLQAHGKDWVWVDLKGPDEGGAVRLDAGGIDDLLASCARARHAAVDAFQSTESNKP